MGTQVQQAYPPAERAEEMGMVAVVAVVAEMEETEEAEVTAAVVAKAGEVVAEVGESKLRCCN